MGMDANERRQAETWIFALFYRNLQNELQSRSIAAVPFSVEQVCCDENFLQKLKTVLFENFKTEEWERKNFVLVFGFALLAASFTE